MDLSFLGIASNPITVFTQADKTAYLQNPEDIDGGIRELVDAINAIPVFFSMSACQGFLIEEERDDHCPETYVDFYVIDEQYQLAQLLLGSLASKFNASIDCKVVYEADFEMTAADEIVPNGMVKLRHSIELYELPADLMKSTYQELVDHVRRFGAAVI
ncbi:MULTISPECIES: hypothetical protein [Acetobacterium]|jgi:hypothetical protein|uniref:Uncharacterized protein n=1 Tax=Acetobacterium wieringae TaxID=52694 RepID=A0A5D0WIV2_9FIRM|nr:MULTISPECIES: hypothetical protein [Acetobacterium]MEA4805791.1 hypothetical protein [Acetobacterium wieringae]OXS27377.1 MAG: hypothetical protein BI182_08515 [Acetobacterium sp. MES1]TYC84172.1 hypothetical protein FXB42_12615 [Acetobacterium wieringae]